ncbi:Vegetative incompatibility protein [Paramyrothecium foliicola]|nr:Vegetative incompatibility protein [Paramyrothecium foliicola]
MEPLAVLGLASAIAQLLDFGTKVLKQAKNYAEVGSLSDMSNNRVGAMARDLSTLCRTIERKTKSRRPHASQEEQSLNDLALQCHSSAEELSNILAKIYNSGSQSSAGHTWKSLRQGFQAVKSEESIQRLSKMLDQYRNHLSLRLLMALNVQQSVNDAKLDRLQETSNEIVEAISLNYRNISSNMREGNDKTLAALLTYRDGRTHSVTSDRISQLISDPGLASSSTTFGENPQRRAESDPPFAFDIGPGMNFQWILDALHFRGFLERRDAISEAHKSTFEWLWKKGEPGNAAKWDDLRDWLRSGSGCYWISGKAGSGKSSLMKYIQEDPRTTAALKGWARDAELIMGSFYFWYAGNDLQKSQTGLLRSLLHDVLSKRPELCLSVFPDLCRTILSGKVSGRNLELSMGEVVSAFSKLIKLAPKSVKMVFLVDGLDEYSGEPNEICELFSRVSTSASIKLLLSSRPIPQFVDHFSHQPKLALQDLTRNDIRNYVWDKLGMNQTLREMEAVEKGVTDTLVESVTSKACGVFLWVVLVVKRLVNSLQNYETMLELALQIERLPSDLERLYEHMLGTQSVQHQVLGSKYLQLVLRSLETGVGLYLLQLSFIEDDNYSKWLQEPPRHMPPDTERWRCRSTEGRLRSRCCGLVEALPLEDSVLVGNDKKIEFFHRTVAEFLQLDNIWTQLTSLTAGSDFNVQTALLSSCLAEFKTATLSNALKSDHSNNPITWRLFRMIDLGLSLDDVSRQKYFYDIYLPEFKKTLHYHWHEPGFFASYEEEFSAIQESAVRAASLLKLNQLQVFEMSCLMRSPVMDLSEQFSTYSGSHITPAHMMAQFVEEQDGRVRRAIVQNLLLGERCTYDPNSANSTGLISRDLIDVWSGKWASIVGHELSMNMWHYLLVYVFVVVRIPGSPESLAATDSITMIMSLLEAIVMLMRHDEGFESGAHSCIYVEMATSKLGIVRVDDITLLAELLRHSWVTAKAKATNETPNALLQISELCICIEDMISRQSDIYTIFFEALGSRQVFPLVSPQGVKKRSGFKSLFGFKSRAKLGNNNYPSNVVADSITNPMVVMPNGETVWRHYRHRRHRGPQR